MKAMILAGGLSTRLYPLTKQVPKPLVPVAGEPNSIHLIRYLEAYGYKDIAINVHYLPDAILKALGNGSKFGVRIEYLHEKELMGSAGAVKALEWYFDEPFVVVGCDDLTDLPLDRLVKFHKEKDAIATIGLVERNEVDQYGVVVVDDDGKITGFQEKPPKGTEKSKLVNTGIYAFTPDIFEQIPANRFYDFGKNVFPSLQQAGEAFFGFDARGAYWCDIGTPGEYRRATYDVLSGAFAIPHTRSHGIDHAAHIASSATIEGDVWVGANAYVEEHATITGPTVIGDGVVVETGARITRSIIWERSRIGSGAVLDGAIVGMDYAVEPGAQLHDAVVANEPVSA